MKLKLVLGERAETFSIVLSPFPLGLVFFCGLFFFLAVHLCLQLRVNIYAMRELYQNIALG